MPGHRVTRVFAPPDYAPFVSRIRARYNSTLRIQTLIKSKCALPSRIVKEQHSFQHSRLSECRVLKAVTQSIAHWWSWTGSNRRPPACKAGALPTELQPRNRGPDIWYRALQLVGLDGFEPSTPALSRRCSNQLSYRPARFAHCVHHAIDRLWVLNRLRYANPVMRGASLHPTPVAAA